MLIGVLDGCRLIDDEDDGVVGFAAHGILTAARFACIEPGAVGTAPVPLFINNIGDERLVVESIEAAVDPTIASISFDPKSLTVYAGSNSEVNVEVTCVGSGLVRADVDVITNVGIFQTTVTGACSPFLGEYMGTIGNCTGGGADKTVSFSISCLIPQNPPKLGFVTGVFPGHCGCGSNPLRLGGIEQDGSFSHEWMGSGADTCVFDAAPGTPGIYSVTTRSENISSSCLVECTGLTTR